MNVFSDVKDWRDLQNKVCQLFNQVGFMAETEKKVKTPRGSIEIDVFAKDPKSIEKIIYNIECKNWNKRVDQNIILAFRSVMNETGADIGYIISKGGFQSGAIEYAKNTNIRLCTYDEFQNRYMNLWLKNYFMPELYCANEKCNCCCEGYDLVRDLYWDKLDDSNKEKYEALVRKYNELINYFFMLSSAAITYENSDNLDLYEETLGIVDRLKRLGVEINVDSLDGILREVTRFLRRIQKQFEVTLGKDVFKHLVY